MSLTESVKGGWYGTVPVILSRVEQGEDGERYTNHLIGWKPPYGGVAVSEEYLGKKFREEPVSWWEAEGFTVTVDKILPILKEWSVEND